MLSAITPARAFTRRHAQLDDPSWSLARPSDARPDRSALLGRQPDLVLLFETDALPYDRLPNDPDKLPNDWARSNLGRPEPEHDRPIVVASVRAAMDLVLDIQTFRDSHRVVRRGQVMPPSEMALEWLGLGYDPSPIVDQPGLFSRRGGILDIFPPGAQPLRIELWGDEVDTIRLFDRRPALDRTARTVLDRSSARGLARPRRSASSSIPVRRSSPIPSIAICGSCARGSKRAARSSSIAASSARPR